MRSFDYSFLKSIGIPSMMFGTAMKVGEFRERNESRRREDPTVYSRMERQARFLSIKESNAIEGIVTSDERISSLVDHDTAPLNHDEMEIAGYRDALEYIHDNYRSMEIDEKTILELYRMMMSYTDKAYDGYKDRNNVIVEVDQSGKRRVHFRPLSARETPEAMEQMILSYTEASCDAGINNLILIPCFILDFLSIHPFLDGNGRMSRLLTLLMLYKEGFDVVRYVSFEEKINKLNDQYYRALSQSSERWMEGENDYLPFIRYYMDILFLCYRELDRRFITLQDKKPSKRNRVEAAVKNSLVPISKKEIIALLPDISESTVEACLHDMVSSGNIEKIGANRNARYRYRN